MSTSKAPSRRPVERARNGFQSRPDQVLDSPKRKEEKKGAKVACKELLNKFKKKWDKKRLSYPGKGESGKGRRNSITSSLPELSAESGTVEEDEEAAPMTPPAADVSEEKRRLGASFDHRLTVIVDPGQSSDEGKATVTTFESEEEYLMAVMEGRASNITRTIRRGTVITEREEKAIQEGRQRHQRSSFKVTEVEYPDENSYGRGYHEDVDIAFVAPELRQHIWGAGGNYADSGSEDEGASS